MHAECREYSELTLISQTTDSQLSDGEEPIRHQIRECVEIEPLTAGGVNASEEEFPHMVWYEYFEDLILFRASYFSILETVSLALNNDTS